MIRKGDEMNRLKPIEEGCLAITINCVHLENNSKFCTPIEDMGIVLTTCGQRLHLWKVDRLFKTYDPATKTPYIPLSRLLRIDDPDLKEESEEELVYIENQ